MDEIIFEHPSKRVSRPPKSSRRVLSPEEKAAQDGIAKSNEQEQEPILQNQERNDPNSDTIGGVESLETPAASSDRRDDQHHRSGNNVTGDDDTAGSRSASLHDLFDLSEDDERSTDIDGPASVEDQFSPPEQREHSVGSDTSLESASEEIREKIPLEHSAGSNQMRQGDSQSEPIIPEDDESDNDTAKRFTFGKRKPGSELGGFDSRIPLSLSDPGEGDEGDSVMGDRQNQRVDEGVGRRDSTATIQKRLRHGDPDQVGERDDDGNDAVGVRGASRQTVLSRLRRNAKGTANLTSQRAEKRHRSASSESSSSDESDWTDNPTPSRKKAAQSTSSQAYRSRRHGRRGARSPKISLDVLTSGGKGRASADAMQSFGHDNSAYSDSRSGSSLNPEKSPPRFQDNENLSCSNFRVNFPHPGDDQDEVEEEIVWLHGRLLGYKVVNGKPFVRVPWYPTWEPPDEYSKEEVDRVKRQWQSRRLRRGGEGRA